MIYLIKSHATHNLSISDPIVEDAIRFVRELQIVSELQKYT